jgi:SRSO17 transposase
MGHGMEQMFQEYLGNIATAVSHADRSGPLGEYLTGLLLPIERKSVEPMAAMLEPHHTSTAHQRMHHFVSKSTWSDEELLRAVRRWALPQITAHDDLKVWIIDDTGFPKKGRHSVGVSRQYCGQLGKQDNCQVAVSLSVAGERVSLPVGYRLYLPQEWAKERTRRSKAGIPQEIEFETKPEIALDLIGAACAEEIPRGVVLADAGYGNDTAFRQGLSELKLAYAVGIQKVVTVWAPGTGPLDVPAYRGKGRPPTRLRRDAAHTPQSVRELAMALERREWRTIAWREGVAGQLKSRFARVRVRVAHRDTSQSTPRDPEWLVVEWPAGESEPTKYWLSTMPADVVFTELIRTIKMRWRIERDYQELKQELGLGHYEGRGWRGFHHHASLCIAAYAFLLCARLAFSPSGIARTLFPATGLPEGFRPRGAPAPSAARPVVVGQHAPPVGRHPHVPAPALSVLQSPHSRTTSQAGMFMT